MTEGQKAAELVMKLALEMVDKLGFEVGHQGYHRGSGILTFDSLEFQEKKENVDKRPDWAR